MAWTDDPIRDFERYDAERERRLARMPHCHECGNPIQEGFFYEFEDGKYICPSCLEENHERWVDDFID